MFAFTFCFFVFLCVSAAFLTNKDSESSAEVIQYREIHLKNVFILQYITTSSRKK